ncbi:MAG TPA: hypothetical protein VKT28_11820 [Puia sp.]|nr:hypothetical protein [Puia sp.]
MRGTSELIHARLCYGNNAKKLYEENEILIQTGLIDTTDEQPPIDAAIIKIDNKEIILTKMKETKSGNLNIKEYAGEQYHLTITDSEKKEDNETMYESDCIVTIGNLKSEYKLTGRYNLGL